MRRSAWFAVLITALALTGCQPKAPSVRAPRAKYIQSVVSLSPSTTEIAMVFVKSFQLRGRTAADDYPVSNVDTVEIVASVKPNYERLAAIKPELVLYDAALFSPDELDKVKKTTGAIMFGFKANSIDEFITELYEFGSLTASEAGVNEYANRIIREAGAAKAEPITPVPKVAVILPGEGGRDYIAGTDSFVASAVKAAGGEPVGPGGNKFMAVNAESLVSMNPDVIIAAGTKENMKGVVALLSNPRYKTLNAIKNQRVHAIDEDVLVRKGARVDQLIKALFQSLSNTSGGGS
ncbi:MAG: ABC transporter substrate-binding protein [Fimbriimonas sp.]